MKRINSYIPKLIVIAFMLGPLQACFFDLEEDTSSIILIEELRSEADITAALVGIYDAYSDIYRNGHALQITGYGADDVTTWWAGNKGPLRVFDGFNYGEGENADIQWLDRPWTNYWRMIYYTNTLVDGLKTSSAPEEAIIVGDAEARLFRALAYFQLVRCYGNMPILLDGTIPTGKETRATVLENYQHIEADLKISESGLPDPGAVAHVGRPSKATAKVMLAELYLTWAGWPVKDEGKYQLAASKAKEIIDMGYFELLPIEELWLEENQNSREALFSVQFSRVELFNNSWGRSNSFHEALGFSDIYPERQFFYDFPEGPRKDITFFVDIPQLTFTNGMIVSKNPSTKPWQQSERKHPMYGKFNMANDTIVVTAGRISSYRAQEVYRYAEVLLIYAEASARANGGTATGAALEAFNQVKRRAAGLPYNQPDLSVDLTSATADEIVEDKGWELAGEYKRWHDLVRLEKVGEAAARRDPTEEVPLLRDASAISWKQYIAPIPEGAIQTSNLTQNPAGFKISPSQ